MSNLTSQWRQASNAAKIAESQLVTLPSGARARLRAVALETFILRGQRMPQSLTSKVANQHAAGKNANQIAAQMSQDELMFSLEFMRRVVVESVVEPRLVDAVINPDEEIALTEIPDADYQFIFQWATNQLDESPATEQGATVGSVAGFRHRKQRKPSVKPRSRRK